MTSTRHHRQPSRSHLPSGALSFGLSNRTGRWGPGTIPDCRRGNRNNRSGILVSAIVLTLCAWCGALAQVDSVVTFDSGQFGWSWGWTEWIEPIDGNPGAYLHGDMCCAYHPVAFNTSTYAGTDNVRFSQGHPGRVPPDMVMKRAAPGSVHLVWSPPGGCGRPEDYAIYEGEIGDERPSGHLETCRPARSFTCS